MKIVYISQRTKKIANAMIAFVNDLPAKPSINKSGAIITIAGKFERI